MADEPITQPTETKPDVLDTAGNALGQDSALNDIFSKIETGKAEGKTTDTVVEEVQKERAEEAAKEPVEPEKKEEVKPEEKKAEEPSDLDKRLDTQKKEKEEDVSRESLRKSEPKPEEKKEEKKEPEKKAEVKPEDEIPADELAPLPHDKPRTAKRIEKLLALKDAAIQSEATTKKELADRDTKLKELQAEIEKVKTVDPKTQDEVKQQLDELKMFRRRYELEKDPEVKEKFDTRVEQAETSIISTLKNKGAGDGLLALIKEEGGWDKFARSSRSVTLNDGTKVTAAQLADQVVQSLPLGDRKAIDGLMMEQLSLVREKDRYFKEQQQTAVKYFEDQSKKQTEQAEAQKKQVDAVQDNINNWMKEVEAKNDWLHERTVKETATPEEKAAIAEDNAYAKKLNILLKKGLATRSLDDALQITLDSVQMFQEKRLKEKAIAEAEGLRKQLKAKQDEIDKFRSASRSTPRTGGNLGSRAEEPAPATKKYGTLEDTLEAIASGRASRSEILSSAPLEE
jgi:hypothetical protein